MPVNKHKSHILKLKKALLKESFEIRALKLIRHGAQTPRKKPVESDFIRMVSDINNGKPQIIFSWFWHHDDVKLFSDNYLSKIDQDMFYKLLDETLSIVNISEAHWIEKVNLFHLFGLSKYVRNKDIQELQNTYQTRNNYGLVSISALTSKYLSKEAESKDANKIMNAFEKSTAIQFYAEYQLYYYGGLENLIQKLKQYIGTPKEILIPTTLYSINSTFGSDQFNNAKINENIIDYLPKSTRSLLNKKLKVVNKY